MAGTAACGGDDDDDNADDGGAPDSGGDGGGADAAPEADAAPVEPDAPPGIEGAQFLLGLEIETAIGTGQFRAIATVALDGATADFAIQPIGDAACVAKGEEAGLPLGAAAVLTDVAIGKDGSFQLDLVGAVIPENAHAIPTCDGDLTIDITVDGALQVDGTACGTLNLTSPIAGTGTFGTISIPNGTVGNDLPDPPLFDCAALAP